MNRLVALMGEQFNPLSVDRQVAETRNIESRNRLADLALGEHQRAVSKSNALMDAWKTSGGDVGAAAKNMMNAGYGDDALALQKSVQAQQKSQVEIDEKTFDMVTKRINFTKQNLGELIQDPNLSYDGIVGRLAVGLQTGVLDAKSMYAMLQGVPQTNDQKALRDYLMRSLSTTLDGEKQFSAYAPKTEFKDVGGQLVGLQMNPMLPGYGQQVEGAAIQKTQSPESKASNAVAWANHQLQKERLAWDKSKPQPGQAGNLNEGQGKATTFASRMENADRIIGDLEGKYSPAAINAKQAVGQTWLVGGALEAATNKMALGENDQKAEQAQRDFINAVLRQESGASIAQDEFDNAKRQYFPQPGDGKDVIAQKARNRRIAIEAMKAQAGPGAAKIPGIVGSGNGAAPAGGGWSIEEVK